MICAYTFMLSLAIVLGFHIQITGPTYDGSIQENYISPYSWFDLSAFLCIWIEASILALALYSKVKALRLSPSSNEGSVQVRQVLPLASIILLLWIPYLLTWWPGFVLSDSIASIEQALSDSWTDYSNHHPVVYTLFIKACFTVANSLGMDITWGCALSTFIQMALVSVSLGYCSQWLALRTNKPKLKYGLALLFAMSQYLASASNAMWKDPLFFLRNHAHDFTTL
ncbi:DUF6020 family protein [Enorma phocaeensis]|uniref:DUF6020 family protein n=1 Tax=Enorma phocaeensis TaxID=1871019 RepID=UPI00320BAC7E